MIYAITIYFIISIIGLTVYLADDFNEDSKKEKIIYSLLLFLFTPICVLYHLAGVPVTKLFNKIEIIQEIRDVVFLSRANRNLKLVKANHRNFLETSIKVARKFWGKKKNTTRRNLLAQLLRQIRFETPYKVQDYSKAEKMYNDYFKLDNAISSFEALRERVNGDDDVWVTCFRRDIPVRGKRYSEYYVNGGGGLEVFKLDREEKSYGFVSDPYINDLGHCISANNITQFLFSTPEEINNKQQKDKKVSDLQKMIKEKEKEVSKLRTKLHNINNG